MTYYTYIHRAGYGRDDHMADELIGRACRQLGGDAGSYIAEACGLASHSVPHSAPNVRVPPGKSVRRTMERALRRAREEMAGRIDVVIDVVCVNEFRDGDGDYVVQHRCGREWRTYSVTWCDDEGDVGGWDG